MSIEERIREIFPYEKDIPEDFGLTEPVEQREFLIGGELKVWRGEMQEVLSPVFVKGPAGILPKVLGRYPLLTEKEALEALDAAVDAYDNGRGIWSTMAVAARIQHIKEFAACVQEKILDHGLEVNPPRRLEARRRDRIERIERADGPGLHVAGAAAIHPALPHHGRERRRLPHLKRTGRHDVAMPLQDQRFAGVMLRTVGADHGAGFRKIMLDRAETAQILQLLDIDMPVVDLVTAPAQQIADHVLARPLRAADRGYGDKLPGGRKLRVETGIDRVEDFLPGIGGVHASRSRCCFQNCSRVNTLPASVSRAMETAMPANRNILFLIIGALIVAVSVLGYNLYQTKKQPEGLQINVGPNGLKIQNK